MLLYLLFRHVFISLSGNFNSKYYDESKVTYRSLSKFSNIQFEKKKLQLNNEKLFNDINSLLYSYTYKCCLQWLGQK